MTTHQKSLPQSIRGPRSGPPVDSSKYNLATFSTSYANARFHIVKSFNEDDVHKSIKYEVWSSTKSGNEKLDASFRYAESHRMPLFLFFSVNTSGQFVGVAEMVGRVDYKKDMNFWQADSWSGFFPLKWHIVKDVPSSCFRHITTLERNLVRSVTATRDAHEVCLKEGLEMLYIFKRHKVEACLLNDFGFYDERERCMMKQKESRESDAVSETNLEFNGLADSNPFWLVVLKQNLPLNSFHNINDH